MRDHGSSDADVGDGNGTFFEDVDLTISNPIEHAMGESRMAGQPPEGEVDMGKRVYFRLYAPEAKEVVLMGSFNNWDPEGRPLKKDRKGFWRTWMALNPGTLEYRFRVDGIWKNDPDADHVPNPYGGTNSVQIVDKA